jgi:hypothetical protein
MPVTRQNITHAELRSLLLANGTTHYDNSWALFQHYRDAFWSQCDPCRQIEIFRMGDHDLGVRARTMLPKHTKLGYYGGILVPIQCGWNSCGVDRKIATVLRSSTIKRNCALGTWVLPYEVYGSALRQHLETQHSEKYYIDAYINGNWAQFINSSQHRPNCTLTRSGEIGLGNKNIQAGDELTLKYYDPALHIAEAQQYLLEYLTAPSIAGINASPWLYPCVKDIVDPDKRKIYITNTENQRFQVTGVQDHPTFRHVFVPHMAKTTTGESYCTLYGRNDTDKADYALQWKQDISHVQTLCDVDSSPHEVQKDVGVFCRQIHSNKTSTMYMDKG